MSKIVFFGTWDKGYARNIILEKALKGHEIKHCHVDLKTDYKSVSSRLNNLKRIPAYIKLFFKYLFIGKHDFVFVQYIGHIEMILFSWLFKLRRKKVIFDIFISLYDTIVEDRKLVDKKSMTAKIAKTIDKLSCKFSDIVIVDTQEHLNYFNEHFNVPLKKMRVVPVGADDELFYPDDTPRENHILFIGKMIPLQGVDVILQAAKLLPNVKFKIVGDGQMFNIMKEKSKSLRNVKFVGSMPYEQLPKLYRRCRLALGIFGHSDKAKRVIPHKVFQAMATKTPVITMESHSITALNNSIYTIKPGGLELAGAIASLLSAPDVCDYYAKKGYELYKSKYTIEQIGKKLNDEVICKK